MSTLVSGIVLASSLVTSAMPETVSLETFVSQQIKQEVTVMQNEFMQGLQNDIANTAHQFSLDSETVRGSVTIKDLDNNAAE